MDLHPDFRDLLLEFARYGVKYALLGGYAVGYHAQPRATKDLDLLVSGEADNQEKVALTLTAFGAPSVVVDAVRRQTAEEIVYFGAPPLRVDLLRSADGIETEAALQRVESVDLGGLTVLILSLDDLIANKLAAGRPQDVADVALLRRIRAKRERG